MKNKENKGISTMKDIAEELNISVSTVSRILNGKVGVRQGPKVQMVKRAAKRLNYQANTTARGLRTSKSGLFGIIVPNIADDYFAGILSGIEQAANEHDYSLVVCQSNESKEKEKQLLKSLLSINVEGILISPSKQTSSLSFLKSVKEAGRELVVFDRYLDQKTFPTIGYNDLLDAYDLGKFLIGKGGKHFAYVGLSSSLSNDKNRLSGYNLALSQSGLPDCHEMYINEMAQVRDAIPEYLIDKDFDTIVCYNDLIAAEVLRFLKSQHIRVPEDIMVCGFDNRALCEYTSPRLTSMHRSVTEIGRLAANTLLGLLEVDEHPVSVRLEARLVVRESTK